MLERWLDGCVVCTKPNGEESDFWDVLLFVLLCKDLLLLGQQFFLVSPKDTNKLTCSKTGMAHFVLYPERPRLMMSNFLIYQPKTEQFSLKNLKRRMDPLTCKTLGKSVWLPSFLRDGVTKKHDYILNSGGHG